MSTNLPAKITKPPTTEIGYVVPGTPDNIPQVLGWNGFVDEIEYVPALKWPDSISIYDKMRADPQIDALFRGLVLPIRRFRWEIDPNGARKEITDALAEDLRLSVIGSKGRRRRGNSFRHDDHLRQSLLALVYGHMFFEMVGRIIDGKWRLRKLSPRMPHTITEMQVARDGALEWIKQGFEWEGPKIPISRLLVFVHEKEGANWFGRSLLRAAYQPWILKDRLLRVDAIRHERNGMGVPFVYLPERATETQKKEGQSLAQQYKIGAASGGALPYGMDIKLKGVEGQTSDVLASIRYHDEAMARLMLQMFVQLGAGSEYGAKALGDTFVEQTAKAQDSVADWYAEVMNEYLLADWVLWNYGPDEDVPLLTFKRDEDPDLSAHEFAQMVAQNVITVDTEMENFLRDRYGLPPLKGERPTPQDFGLPGPDNFPPGEDEQNENALIPPPNRPAKDNKASKSPLELTTRFRRGFTAVEAASGADFGRLQGDWEQALREITSVWRPIREAQVEEIINAVRAAGSVSELAALEPSVRGVDELASIMQRMAISGVDTAMAEAASQGFDIPRPRTPETRGMAEAISNVMSRALGSAAARVATRTGAGELGAAAVRDWAGNLSDVYVEETLGGALTSAQNAGRFEVWAAAGDGAKFYASEIMDGNTCAPCASNDNRPYTNLAAAHEDYPAGTYIHCVAGTRCRGTILAVWDA